MSAVSSNSAATTTNNSRNKKRPRLLLAVSPRDRLAFGTFSDGGNDQPIFRNSLSDNETFEDGHVSIYNLVPPDTYSCLCTTFCPPDSVEWLCEVFCNVSKLLIVTHDNRDKKDDCASISCNSRLIGDAELVNIDDNNNNTTNKHPDWHYLLCKPHTNGCLHAKLILLRCRQGLRVVVCGSNLYAGQWHVDRDCLWVQDFHAATVGGSSTTTTTNPQPCGNHYCASEFETTLRSFLSDLTTCRRAADRALVQSRLKELWDGIDMSNTSARLVFSFPRSNHATWKNTTCKKTAGGYRMLAEAVRNFYSELDTGSDDDCSDDEDNPVVLGVGPQDSNNDNNMIAYAMAGSFGNIAPDFLLQMHHALRGEVRYCPSRDTPWSSVLQTIRCLWPSRETALQMNLLSLIGHTRPIPRDYWDKRIPTVAKRHIFFDAPPNPSFINTTHNAQRHPVSHAKVLFAPSNNNDNSNNNNHISIVYVGSHNFSKAAWGLRGEMPRNVEMGVVLATTDQQVCDVWRQRLPCVLPPPFAQSPPHYIPASVNQEARDALERNIDRPEEAIQMAREWLMRNEEASTKHEETINEKTRALSTTTTPSYVIDLCDSD